MTGSSPSQWEHWDNQNNLPENHYLRKYHPHWFLWFRNYSCALVSQIIVLQKELVVSELLQLWNVPRQATNSSTHSVRPRLWIAISIANVFPFSELLIVLLNSSREFKCWKSASASILCYLSTYQTICQLSIYLSMRKKIQFYTGTTITQLLHNLLFMGNIYNTILFPLVFQKLYLTWSKFLPTIEGK